MLYFLTGTDIPRAFSLCDRLAAGSAREPEHQRNCYTGVTMKLFFVFFEDEVPDWRALTIETAPAFCESLGASRYVGACKRASWILHADEFADGDGIIDFCNDQPDEEEVQLCFTKVFHGLAWKNVDSPEAMVPLCRRMPGDLETLCLLNAGVELLISGGGTTVLPQAVSLCEAAADARTCLRDLAWYGRFLYRVGPDRDAYCAHFSDDLGNRCASVPYE